MTSLCPNSVPTKQTCELYLASQASVLQDRMPRATALQSHVCGRVRQIPPPPFRVVRWLTQPDSTRSPGAGQTKCFDSWGWMRTKLSGHQEGAGYPPGHLAATVLPHLIRGFPSSRMWNATEVLTPGALVGGGHCEVQHSHSLTPMTVLSWYLRGVAERVDCWWQQNSQGVTRRVLPTGLWKGARPRLFSAAFPSAGPVHWEQRQWGRRVSGRHAFLLHHTSRLRTQWVGEGSGSLGRSSNRVWRAVRRSVLHCLCLKKWGWQYLTSKNSARNYRRQCM